jgi:hypothetical protein
VGALLLALPQSLLKPIARTRLVAQAIRQPAEMGSA